MSLYPFVVTFIERFCYRIFFNKKNDLVVNDRRVLSNVYYNVHAELYSIDQLNQKIVLRIINASGCLKVLDSLIISNSANEFLFPFL
ncbi:hypothetical protein [Candidatus Nitrosocosmicus sp. T]